MNGSNDRPQKPCSISSRLQSPIRNRSGLINKVRTSYSRKNILYEVLSRELRKRVREGGRQKEEEGEG